MQVSDRTQRTCFDSLNLPYKHRVVMIGKPFIKKIAGAMRHLKVRTAPFGPEECIANRSHHLSSELKLFMIQAIV